MFSKKTEDASKSSAGSGKATRKPAPATPKAPRDSSKGKKKSPARAKGTKSPSKGSKPSIPKPPGPTRASPSKSHPASATAPGYAAKANAAAQAPPPPSSSSPSSSSSPGRRGSSSKSPGKTASAGVIAPLVPTPPSGGSAGRHGVVNRPAPALSTEFLKTTMTPGLGKIVIAKPRPESIPPTPPEPLPKSVVESTMAAVERRRTSSAAAREEIDARARSSSSSSSAGELGALAPADVGGPAITLAQLKTAAKAVVSKGDPMKHYADFEPVWSGIRSSVYEAVDTTVKDRNKARVAVKRTDYAEPVDLMEPYSLDRLVRNIPLMKSVKHRSIVATHDAFMTDSQIWIVMEQASLSLQTLIQTVPKYGLAEDAMAVVVREALTGLQALHNQGILHRGVQSDALLFVKNGRADMFRSPRQGKGKKTVIPSLKDLAMHSARFTLDDELSKIPSKQRASLLASTEYDVKLGLQHAFATKAKSSKEVIGSPCYMSPQIVQGQSYGPDADIWALGVVLYEMIEQEPPYEDMEPVEAMTRIAQTGCPPLQAPELCSEALRDFLTKMLTVDPKKRLTAASALKHPWLNKARVGALDRLLARHFENRPGAPEGSETESSSSGSDSDSDDDANFDIDDDPQLYSCLYDYTANEEGELSFKEGDLLEVVKKSASGWWRAVTEDGRKGMIPANYVEAYKFFL